MDGRPLKYELLGGLGCGLSSNCGTWGGAVVSEGMGEWSGGGER